MPTNRIPRVYYNLVLVGGARVGKSALVVVFNNLVFGYDPPIEESYRKQTVVDGEAGSIEVFDPAGQEGHLAMDGQYIRDGEGFILIYSITSRASFKETSKFHQQILQIKGKGNLSTVLVGNKCDLEHERQVGVNEGRDLAKHLGCIFMETSTKHPFSVDQAFYSAVREVGKYSKDICPGGGPLVEPAPGQRSNELQPSGRRDGCVVL